MRFPCAFEEFEGFDWRAIYSVQFFQRRPIVTKENCSTDGWHFLLCSAVSFHRSRDRPIFLLGNQCTCDLGTTAVNGSSPWYCGIGRSGHVSAPSSRWCCLPIDRVSDRSFSAVVRGQLYRSSSSRSHLPSSIWDRRAVTRVYARVPTYARADGRVHLVSGVSLWSPVESRTCARPTPRDTFLSLNRYSRRTRSMEKCRGTLEKVCAYGKLLLIFCEFPSVCDIDAACCGKSESDPPIRPCRENFDLCNPTGFAKWQNVSETCERYCAIHKIVESWYRGVL